MSKTEHFQLDYLDPKQLTSRDVLEDKRRFTAIDNNLFALFKIFGNGILVLDSTEFPLYVETFTNSSATKKINVSSGRAFVNYKSIHYTTTTEINLPVQSSSVSSQKFYLYLKDTNETILTELGEFVFSSEKLPISTEYIGLGAIQVNYSTGTAEFFDDSDNGREILNVKKLFINFINTHKHTGGLGNPKKIDLSNDTTGQILPEAISFVDADKIRSGQLSKFVTPQVDHNSLRNTGNLSHSQIDSAILSFRDDLNFEIISSVNQLKLLSGLIRTTTDTALFTGSAAYPSGSIATIDRTLSNVFIYVPNITTDGFVVGYSGSLNNKYPNPSTNATGPSYLNTTLAKMAQIDRQNKVICTDISGSTSSNTQRIFTLQSVNPKTKIDSYGQTGYFGGFIAGMRTTLNSGSTHLIHHLLGTSGSGTTIYENFENYNLTYPDNYNSAGPYGFSGVQISCLLTNLPDFSPTAVYSDSNYNFLLYSGQFTGPRLLPVYHNGYISNLTPTALFASTGPLGVVKSFYFETSSGARAALFSGGNIIANMGANDYLMTSLGNGSFTKTNSKIMLSEFSTSRLRLTELGPTGPIQYVSITDGGTNITQASIYNFSSSSDYRVFYIDNNRLKIAEPDSITELGFFPSSVHMIVKNNLVFILSNENETLKVYHAYQTGSPTVFSEFNTLVAAPSGSTISAFTNGENGTVFACVVSGYNFYIYNLSGKNIYNYKPGPTSGPGPRVEAIYSQFDLGDATVDLKYG